MEEMKGSHSEKSPTHPVEKALVD